MAVMGLKLKNDIGKTQQQGLSQESLLSSQLPGNSLSIKYLVIKAKEPKFKLKFKRMKSWWFQLQMSEAWQWWCTRNIAFIKGRDILLFSALWHI